MHDVFASMHAPMVHTPDRSTYCTRLLYAAVPSAMYAKNDKTFDALIHALVDDWNRLYREGFQVPGFHFTTNALGCVFQWSGVHAYCRFRVVHH